jgi:hypothetical protein
MKVRDKRGCGVRGIVSQYLFSTTGQLIFLSLWSHYGTGLSEGRMAEGGRIKMSPAEQTGTVLDNPKVNIRILLAAFWIGHFLLWSFGDMLSVLQQENEPITDNLILFVAPTTATVQALMIVLCLIGPPQYVRLTNLIVGPIFMLFDIGFLSEASEGWHYYLGIVYLLFDVLIIWHAWKWPKKEDGAGPKD